MRSFLPILASFLLSIALAAPLDAQMGWNTSRPQMTRAELTSLLERLQTISQANDQPAEIRNEAQREAVRLRARLEEGDFRVGDQIDLRVEGEDALSQVFTLRPGPTLQLPTIGDVSLRGVLRSELQDHLSSAIGEYIRDPVVLAESTIRLTISGSVGNPGFHSVPPDRALTDAIMLAGGAQRGGEPAWHLYRASGTADLDGRLPAAGDRRRSHTRSAKLAGGGSHRGADRAATGIPALSTDLERHPLDRRPGGHHHDASLRHSGGQRFAAPPLPRR